MVHVWGNHVHSGFFPPVAYYAVRNPEWRNSVELPLLLSIAISSSRKMLGWLSILRSLISRSAVIGNYRLSVTNMGILRGEVVYPILFIVHQNLLQRYNCTGLFWPSLVHHAEVNTTLSIYLQWTSWEDSPESTLAQLPEYFIIPNLRASAESRAPALIYFECPPHHVWLIWWAWLRSRAWYWVRRRLRSWHQVCLHRQSRIWSTLWWAISMAIKCLQALNRVCVEQGC